MNQCINQSFVKIQRTCGMWYDSFTRRLTGHGRGILRTNHWATCLNLIRHCITQNVEGLHPMVRWTNWFVLCVIPYSRHPQRIMKTRRHPAVRKELCWNPESYFSENQLVRKRLRSQEYDRTSEDSADYWDSFRCGAGGWLDSVCKGSRLCFNRDQWNQNKNHWLMRSFLQMDAADALNKILLY